jgi:glutamyl-tRNA reductase
VEAIVAGVVREYMRWYQSRVAVPLIASLRRKAEAIRLAEIGKLFARLPELDSHQRELIAGASVSILNKLLHAPVTRLRESAAESGALRSDTTERLLDLETLGARLEEQLAEALRPPRPRRRG